VTTNIFRIAPFDIYRERDTHFYMRSLNAPVAYAKRPSQAAGIHPDAPSATQKMPDDSPVLASAPEPCDPTTDGYFHSMDWRPSGIMVVCVTESAQVDEGRHLHTLSTNIVSLRE
jgi:hypothetical protein